MLFGRRSNDSPVLLLHHLLFHRTVAVPQVVEETSRDNAKWKHICWSVGGSLTAEDVGTRREFNCKQEVAIATLKMIEEKTTPMEMHRCIMSTIETISTVVQAHLLATKMQSIAIATDDLLPLLALVLVQANVVSPSVSSSSVLVFFVLVHLFLCFSLIYLSTRFLL